MSHVGSLGALHAEESRSRSLDLRLFILNFTFIFSAESSESPTINFICIKYIFDESYLRKCVSHLARCPAKYTRSTCEVLFTNTRVLVKYYSQIPSQQLKERKGKWHQGKFLAFHKQRNKTELQLALTLCFMISNFILFPGQSSFQYRHNVVNSPTLLVKFSMLIAKNEGKAGEQKPSECWHSPYVLAAASRPEDVTSSSSLHNGGMWRMDCTLSGACSQQLGN